MTGLRAIPGSLWLWTGLWLVVLAFLLPALNHYGESKAIEHRADGLLMALLFVTMPISSAAGPFVSLMRPITRLLTDPDGGADFVLTLLWWFAAGYLQWFLLLRLIRTAALDRRAKPDAAI